jgi:HPt (histidine-containing phosphotransfer) domain-containing protein
MTDPRPPVAKQRARPDAAQVAEEVTRAVAPQLESFAHELVVAILNLELHSAYGTDVQENLAQLLDDLRTIGAGGLVETFIQSGEKCLRDIDTGLARGDLKLAARAAHSLVGASANIGMSLTAVSGIQYGDMRFNMAGNEFCCATLPVTHDEHITLHCFNIA